MKSVVPPAHEIVGNGHDIPSVDLVVAEIVQPLLPYSGASRAILGCGWLRAGANDDYAIGYYTQSELAFLGTACSEVEEGRAMRRYEKSTWGAYLGARPLPKNHV